MNKKYWKVLFGSMFLILGSLGAPVNVIAKSYVITDIGFLEDDNNGIAIDINDMSQITGWSNNQCGFPCSDPDHQFRHQGFLWSVEIGMLNLGTLGGKDTQSTGINNLGHIVGNSDPANSTRTHPFIWTPEDGMVDIGTLGGVHAEASDINDYGQVSGSSYTTTSTDYHAFLWTEQGGMINLGSLVGGRSTGNDINKLGQILVNRWPISNIPYVYHNGTIEGLGTLGGESKALAINDHSQVVGFSYTPAEMHACLWENGAVTDLDTLDSSSSQALDINDYGVVVGFVNLTSVGRHAFIWDDSNGMRDLNELLPEESGWLLIQAKAINNVGQIVGNGKRDLDGDGIFDGYYHPFLLSPDADDDGVPDFADECPDTWLPENIPTKRLGINRFVDTDGDCVFDTTAPNGQGPQKYYTIEDTAGCSCEQIIEAQGLGKGHLNFGCSISAMEDWISLVTK